jgi:hypothetical protein
MQALALAHKISLTAKEDRIDGSPLKIFQRLFSSSNAVDRCSPSHEKQGLLAGNVDVKRTLLGRCPKGMDGLSVRIPPGTLQKKGLSLHSPDPFALIQDET